MQESRRVRMTKKMIKDALLELLEEKSLGKVSVTDVCTRADVNRSTFYTYYRDVDDLVSELEREVLEHIPHYGTTLGDEAAFLSMLTSFFGYVRENERLFRVLLFSSGDGRFSSLLASTILGEYGVPAKTENDMHEEELRKRCSYMYCIYGVIGLLKTWIDEGFFLSDSEFASAVISLSKRTVSIV